MFRVQAWRPRSPGPWGSNSAGGTLNLSETQKSHWSPLSGVYDRPACEVKDGLPETKLKLRQYPAIHTNGVSNCTILNQKY